MSLPVMLYVHGFMSGSNGAKQKQLQTYFEGRYKVIAPELDANPDESLDILNNVIAAEQPKIIIGTSLGGWMTLMCDSPDDTELVIVNPSLFPYQTLSRWIDIPQKYFCKRLDGVQRYTLTFDILNLYPKYDAIHAVKKKLNRLHALCSSNDELIGSIHIDHLTLILPPERLIVTDDFGHQCKGSGLKHLFQLIENIVKNN